LQALLRALLGALQPALSGEVAAPKQHAGGAAGGAARRRVVSRRGGRAGQPTTLNAAVATTVAFAAGEEAGEVEELPAACVGLAGDLPLQGEKGETYPTGAAGEAGLQHAGLQHAGLHDARLPVAAVELEPLVLVAAAAAEGGSESEGEDSTAEAEAELEEELELEELGSVEAGGGGGARTASGLWVAAGATVRPRSQRWPGSQQPTRPPAAPDAQPRPSQRPACLLGVAASWGPRGAARRTGARARLRSVVPPAPAQRRRSAPPPCLSLCPTLAPRRCS
jgi:hypothetical protein